MDIYKSDFLSIRKEDETLIQTWTDKDLNTTDYQQELRNFMDVFNKIRPKNLVWDTKKYKLALPSELDEWMGAEVLIPIYKKGIRELIFAIPEDTTVHLSIVESFEKACEIIRPVYFSNFNEAAFYTTHKQIMQNNSLPKVNYNLNMELNSFDVNLNISPNDLPRLLHSMKQIEQDNQFKILNQDRYNSLTIREIHVLKLIVFGKTNKQIGIELFID